MNNQTLRRQKLSHLLQKVLDNIPESHLVQFRQRTIRKVLVDEYPELIKSVSKEKMIEFFKEIIYLDRKLRLLTEGEQKKEKKLLSDEFIVRELA